MGVERKGGRKPSLEIMTIDSPFVALLTGKQFTFTWQPEQLGAVWITSRNDDH